MVFNDTSTNAYVTIKFQGKRRLELPNQPKAPSFSQNRVIPPHTIGIISQDILMLANYAVKLKISMDNQTFCKWILSK